jgi:hypothetical protein
MSNWTKIIFYEELQNIKNPNLLVLNYVQDYNTNHYKLTIMRRSIMNKKLMREEFTELEKK